MRNNDGRFRTIMVTGLVPLLLLGSLPGCAARHKTEWSRVQAVAPETTTEVQRYEDSSTQEQQKIKGRFLSATDDSVALKLKNGQTDTFQKENIRKVLTRRPLVKRWPGWAALAVTFGVVQTLLSMTASVDNVSGSTMVGAHAVYTLPITAAFFYGSRMGGIYEVPSKDGDWFPQGPDAGSAPVEKAEKGVRVR